MLVLVTARVTQSWQLDVEWKLVIMQDINPPIQSRAALQNHLLQQGFSLSVASWVTSNLRPSQDDPR